ncbi:hypothetical protein [Stutzerimonas kunmingensis]|uniref:hypothetical protein n=1 Tax=Stutzerimonas kunmingensis TaxID=1211807 RepID=UPI002FCB9FBA
MNDIVPADFPLAPSYDRIKELEQEIVKLPPVETPVTHHFAHGVYGREMFIPAGTVLTGKIHRYSTLNLLIEGEITVTTPEGMKRISAPAVFVSPPNCKKVGFAHTDVRWVNVHATRMTDVASIEQKFIVPEPPVTDDRLIDMEKSA